MAEVASIVIFTDKREETVACYGALGIVLADEEHGDGVVQAAGEVGGVHLAVVPAAAAGISPRWRAGGSTFVGFWVSSLEATVARLAALGTTVLLGHQDCEWGCRVVVADPDGRAVEVNQRHHCPAR